MTNLKGPPATSKARPTTSEGAWAFFFSDNADKTTTVPLTLAAHARRGLIMLVYERDWSMAATHAYAVRCTSSQFWLLRSQKWLFSLRRIFWRVYIADLLQPSSSYSDDIETTIDRKGLSLHAAPCSPPGSGTFPRTYIEIRTEPCPNQCGECSIGAS